MSNKFIGSFEELKHKVDQTKVSGEWRDCANGQKQFKAKNGAILNWWETRGTLLFQGSKDKASPNSTRTAFAICLMA